MTKFDLRLPAQARESECSRYTFTTIAVALYSSQSQLIPHQQVEQI